MKWVFALALGVVIAAALMRARRVDDVPLRVLYAERMELPNDLDAEDSLDARIQDQVARTFKPVLDPNQRPLSDMWYRRWYKAVNDTDATWPLARA